MPLAETKKKIAAKIKSITINGIMNHILAFQRNASKSPASLTLVLIFFMILTFLYGKWSA